MRELGSAAKQLVLQLTRNADLKVIRLCDYDKSPKSRILIELSGDGNDVGQVILVAEHPASWRHDGSK